MSSAFAYGIVVDDHPAARQWLTAAVLEAFPGIEVTEAIDLATARAALARRLPDLAVIDLGLPDGSGIDLIREIHQLAPDASKIVSTVFGDDQHLFDALRAGAEGYVLKDEAQDKMRTMLKGITEGEPPLSPSIARRLLRQFNDQANEPAVHLTSRESEVLTLIAKGYTVQRVGDLLDITRNTTAGYVKDIYRKLNVTNRAEATLEATRRGLVSPGSS